MISAAVWSSRSCDWDKWLRDQLERRSSVTLFSGYSCISVLHRWSPTTGDLARHRISMKNPWIYVWLKSPISLRQSESGFLSVLCKSASVCSLENAQNNRSLLRTEGKDICSNGTKMTTQMSERQQGAWNPAKAAEEVSQWTLAEVKWERGGVQEKGRRTTLVSEFVSSCTSSHFSGSHRPPPLHHWRGGRGGAGKGGTARKTLSTQ